MLNPKHTACRQCIFAIWNGKDQTGCKGNKIESFRRRGFQVIEAFDEEEYNFCVVDGVKCLFHRKQEWADQYRIVEDESEYWDMATYEISLKYQVIIIANHSLDDVNKTIQSAVNQVHPPKHISVIRPVNCQTPRIPLLDILQETGIPWRMENMMDPSLPITSHIDIVIDFVGKQRYYAVFQAGFEIPKHTFSYLNDALTHGELQFLALSPNSTDNGFMISLDVHKMLQGNAQEPILDKLKDKGEEAWQLVKPINQTIPNFPQ